jgi:hypothetical protein
MADSYIVGSARSGTTLLLNQLIARYQVASVPETHFLSRYGGSFTRFKESLHFKEVCAALDVESVEGYDEIWSLTRERANVRHAIEKTPKHLRHIGKLPERSFVVIMKRNFLDTVRSNLATPWNYEASVPRIVFKVLLDLLFELFYRVIKWDRIITITYSDLVSDPDSTLRRVAGFLGLEPRLESAIPSPEVMSDRETSKREATEDVNEARKYFVGAWPRFGETNVRNTIMYDCVADDRDFVVFDIKKRPFAAVFCDVVHFHWPEKAFEGRRTLIKAIGFLGYCAVLRVFHVQIIQTVHNDWRSHVRQRYFRLYELYQSMVAVFMVPSSASISVIPSGSRWNLLPLGLYPGLIEDSSCRSDYYLIVGRLTRKKNIEAQLRSLELPAGTAVVVAGMPESQDYGEQLRKTASEIQRERGLAIELRLNTLSEEEMHRLVADAKCVLATYEKGLNSGILTLAATYGTPVFTNMAHLGTDMRRLYGQFFTSDISSPVPYIPSALSIERVGARYKKLLRKMI